ncbi:hypothetical protein POJ06DRAFT_257502 [Lipomyces tetrasporus]|uniref:Beach-domain-containing protein n=1 Tax=Lipomyces tetrasporus TaxID=54092 RepID=A0AAD7QNW6_9ASCO|nr:uncharacterized protein POJ06DRAFT_257502 [Lipomyces tetrasporus]KAJ8098609.1 hypothetical protein POJ06DRAFT_257502 [Lipomyces tetrasporus]
MVNSLSPMPSGSGARGRSVSPTRHSRTAGPVVSTVNASATPHPIRTLVESLNSDDEFVFRLHSLYELQRNLVESPESKDVFRLSLGFESVVEALTSIVATDDDVGFSEPMELLKCIFNIFSDALFDAPVNRRYFTDRIGLDTIKIAVVNTGLIDQGPKEVLGILFAFMISDFSITTFFNALGHKVRQLSDTSSPADIIRHIHEQVISSFSRDIVRNPFAVTFIYDILQDLPEEDVYISVAVLVCLTSLAGSSAHNKVAIYGTGIMDWILPLAWNDKGIDKRILTEYQCLTDSLMELGVGTPTAKSLFHHAMKSNEVAKVLLSGIRASREPAHIVFDLSLNGYSTIELNSLGRTFPPASSGYTFTAWIKIDKYDYNNHTTLFGVFDNSQRCFTLVYIEKETKKLILQTSVTSSRGSVRFKSVNFEPGNWYFICVSHKKSRVSSGSKASLHVNGEFVETIKCPYPSNPPNDGHAQAFIGTPADLTPGPGPNLSHSIWRLSSLHIFEDILSDDTLAVHYRLGPRYYGNYQDALASFQTYEASAALTLRNENLHAGREESSDIINAIRGRASNLLPEFKILLSIHAKNVINPRTLQNEHGFRQSPKNITLLSRNHLIIVNAAVPDINIAVSSPNGIGIGSGDPVPVIPQSLDDAAWRLGGSALSLKMAELANTPEQLCRAVSIAFETLRENWRNSDDMERVHGFAILGNLIKIHSDSGMINRKLLNIVLEFVGHNFQDPLESMIINPLAYRILLVDFDIWKVADIGTLRVYFDQFAVFGLQSKYHTYNAKRLTRMRIVKKFLQALKTGSFTREALDYFIPAFKRIIQTNVSAEVMRSLSLFITYSFNENASSSLKRLQDEEKFSQSDTSRAEIGFMVLRIFTEILCDPSSSATVKKFARTVTNKWVLFLLAQDDRRAVIAGAKILARLLIIHGPSYVTKFATKNGGFVIMKERLKSRWIIPELWPICLAILFGIDVATLEIKSTLDLFHLVEMFRCDGKAAVVYPEMFTVIGAMLKAGALSIISEEHRKDERVAAMENNEAKSEEPLEAISKAERAAAVPSARTPSQIPTTEDFGKYLQVLTQFFSEMHATCLAFQEFCTKPAFLQEILGILFPAICNSESVSPEIELQSRDSALTFDGGDIVVRPASRTGNPAQIMKTVKAPSTPSSTILSSGERPRASSLRRGSSFVLVTSDLNNSPSGTTSTSSKASLSTVGRKTRFREFKVVNRVVEGLLEMVVAVFVDQVLIKKDFSELSISILIPPTFQEYQIYFETYLLRNTVAQLNTTISLNMRLLCESRTLINFGKFAQQLVDSVFNGWFLGGAEPLLELIGMVIEYLQQPTVERLKHVRLCLHVVSNLRLVFMKLVLFRLAELDDIRAEPEAVVKFLDRMLYWQNVLLSPAFTEDNLIKLICYLLYIQLIDANVHVRHAAANNWRMVLVHKPVETSLILDQVKSTDRQLTKGFKKLMELDNSSFLEWVDTNRAALDDFFLGTVSKEWEIFVGNENKMSEDNAKLRMTKRRERLRQTANEDNHNRVVFNDHKMSLRYWQSAIYNTEHIKFMRNLQDQQDTLTFLSSEYSKLEIDLTRPRGVIEDGKKQRWRLDLTEGKDRMRKRMIPDTRGNLVEYLPKGEEISQRPTLEHSDLSVTPQEVSDELSEMTVDDTIASTEKQDASASNSGSNVNEGVAENDDGFEMVEDPRGQKADDDAYEDKNRKVLRSLEQGDSVVDLWNVCRIIGLESVEGLLIQGRNNLYLIDNFFQRSDGEIVNLWEAPTQERDPYLQTIAGSDKQSVRSLDSRQHDSRHWSLDDLVSVSRRQFLFRNVALEFFFADGRSFLITTISVKERDAIHNQLIGKVSISDTNSGATFSDELWRMALQPSLQGGFAGQLGKIANVFATGTSNIAARRWVKGEISNFYYLMLVNTMAGRTYNDLTQYPVFPWVIADYTSAELDLTNPASYRDLSKPMGAQTPEREKEFRDRYQSLADLNDNLSPPFHYGTHFSSAMIVSSYLIRLEPFVQSYLLLQGGHFDHADRLFYSIERAWQSASRENMADVRELIPEFFYLPEFLVNANEFKFGTLQGSGAEISSVQLPPWAKGDAKIFIQKNREALESPYVSQHLHEWIDLVFGYKQRGEAAVEATNVFHHLSYHGAIDLDKIEDPLERIATIGIIHNFGQTPHQVFTRPHPQREVLKPVQFEVDKELDSLLQMLSPMSDINKRFDYAISLFKGEREKLMAQMNPLFCAFVPPSYDRMVEWGFCDDGVRFKLIENGKLIGHVEKLHQSHLTCVKIADPRTLVTAGYDCVICVWRMQGNLKSMEVQFKASLRGHTTPILSLAISRSFSAIVSASEDGIVLVWDLNRLRFVRELNHERKIKTVAISDETGEILTSDGSSLYLWTINGDLILSKVIPEDVEPNPVAAGK